MISDSQLRLDAAVSKQEPNRSAASPPTAVSELISSFNSWYGSALTVLSRGARRWPNGECGERSTLRDITRP